MSRLSLLALAALGALSAGPLAAQHRPIQRLNIGGFNPNGNNAQDGVRVAAQGPRFVAVWAEQFGTTQSTQDIYAAVSNDDGLTWNGMTRVDLGDANNASDSDQPKVAICSDGAICVAWEDNRHALANGSTNEDILFNRSTDGGVTWQPVSIALNTATAGAHVTSDIDELSILADGNAVHVIWEEDGFGDTFGAEQVLYTRSTDSGATWSAPVFISTQTVLGQITPGINEFNDVDNPQIAAQGANVVVAYIDDVNSAAPGSRQDDGYASVSHDGGLTWTVVPLEANPTGDVDNLQVAADGTTFVCLWRDEGVVAGGQVHTCSSLDGGVTWGVETLVSPAITASPGGQESDYGHVDVVGITVFATWVDDHLNPAAGAGDSGERKAYVAASYDGGLTWQPAVALDAGPGNTARRNHFTRVVATPRIAYVWFEIFNFGANDNAYAYSVDGGVTWSQVDVFSAGDTDSPGAQEGVFFAVSPVSQTAVGVFNNNPLGQNEVYALGIRAPRVALGGAPILGQPFNFGVRSAFGPGFLYLVGISGTGSSPATDLGGGLLLHLSIDFLTIYALTEPALAPFFNGVTGLNGDGDCLSFPYPFGPGVTLYATAIVIDPFLGVFAGATDPVAFTSL